MNDQLAAFDPVKFRKTTRSQWEAAAEAWNRWGDFIGRWLAPATERMLELARIGPGAHVVDVAAGRANRRWRQPAAWARRPVLATDISPGILRYAERAAQAAGLHNIETKELDGERHETVARRSVRRGDFARWADLLSRPAARTPRTAPAPEEGRPHLRRGVLDADKQRVLLIPVSIIRRRAQLPPPFPGQPGPFSLGAEGALAQCWKAADFDLSPSSP